MKSASISILFFASIALAQTPTRPTTTAPTINKPSVLPPKVPEGAPPSAPAMSAASGPGKPYNEAEAKTLADADRVLVLTFAKGDDAKWMGQVPTLTTVLREREFAAIAVMQVDLATQATIAEKMAVIEPGTILILKGGIERVRSTAMVKADPVRRMLRLIPVL